MVKIKDKDYTDEELADLIEKGNDYTQKTQAVASEKRDLDVRAAKVASYENMEMYAMSNPKFAGRLRGLIDDELKGANRGTVGSPNKPQAKTNMGYGNSNYTPDADENDDDSGKKPVMNNYMTREEFNDSMAEWDARSEQRRNNERVQDTILGQVKSELKELVVRGYTQAEIIKITDKAKAEDRYPLEIAERMAFKGEVADRLSKKAPKPDDNVVVLKGSAASGADLDISEEELIKGNYDPRAMLEARASKLFIKE